MVLYVGYNPIEIGIFTTPAPLFVGPVSNLGAFGPVKARKGLREGTLEENDLNLFDRTQRVVVK